MHFCSVHADPERRERLVEGYIIVCDRCKRTSKDEPPVLHWRIVTGDDGGRRTLCLGCWGSRMTDLDDMAAAVETQIEEWGVPAAKNDTERTRARAEGWGLGPASLVVRRLIPAAKAIRDRVVALEGRADQGAAAIQDLRARVKALEDAQP